jgi:hypothetical protein
MSQSILASGGPTQNVSAGRSQLQKERAKNYVSERHTAGLSKHAETVKLNVVYFQNHDLVIQNLIPYPHAIPEDSINQTDHMSGLVEATMWRNSIVVCAMVGWDKWWQQRESISPHQPQQEML